MHCLICVHVCCPPCPPQLFDLVYREETLLNVIKSVTRNGRSIILTAVLALILVYLFSIIGFLFLKDDFIMEVDRLKIRSPAAGVFVLLKLPTQSFSGCPAWHSPRDVLRAVLILCPSEL